MDVKKIKNNDWSLSIGKYKPVKVDNVKHEKPEKILKEVLGIEEEIAGKIKELLKEVGK